MKTSRQSPIHIICFLDGSPGHEKQTLGIIRALEKRVNIKTTKMNVARRSFWQSFLGIVRLNLPISTTSDMKIVKPDLIIGTGSRTHLSILHYKKKFNIPAVTCMAPDPVIRFRFDICFVPVHDGLEQRGNIILTVGPPNCSINKKQHRKDCGLILIGGIDRKSHRWNSSELKLKTENIVKRNPETQWLISSSPRTPDDMVLMLEEIPHRYFNVTFYNFKDTEPGWVEQQYDISTTVWVTADSVSMIFEALTAGCKVGVLPVDWKKQTNKFLQGITYLEERGFILPYERWFNQNGTWIDHDNLNEAQRCADTILKRWWPTN